MSVSSYPFYSLPLKLPNKRISFLFPPLKLPNKGNEEYSKIILFIYFHSISFTLPKWELNSSTQFKWILLDNFPKKHVMTLAIEYIVQEKQKLKVMSKIKREAFWIITAIGRQKELEDKKQKQRKWNGEGIKEERSQRTQRHPTNRVLFFWYTIFILTDVMKLRGSWHLVTLSSP